MKINIVIGRFQPLTMGHIRCAQCVYKQFGLKTVFCIIRTSEDKINERHPFTSKTLIDLYTPLLNKEAWYGGVVEVVSADIVKISEQLKEFDYQIAAWTCGTDREAPYRRMSTNYKEQANLTGDFELIVVHRTDEDISATQARAYLRDGMKDDFESVAYTRKDPNIYKSLQALISK